MAEVAGVESEERDYDTVDLWCWFVNFGSTSIACIYSLRCDLRRMKIDLKFDCDRKMISMC